MLVNILEMWLKFAAVVFIMEILKDKKNALPRTLSLLKGETDPRTMESRLFLYGNVYILRGFCALSALGVIFAIIETSNPLFLRIAAGVLFAGVTALIYAWLLPTEKQFSDTKYYYACIKYDEGHEIS